MAGSASSSIWPSCASVVVVALLVRPQDFFTVGVLPPLIMLVVFVVLGISHKVAIARDSDGLVQAVITGLSHHAVALGAG